MRAKDVLVSLTILWLFFLARALADEKDEMTVDFEDIKDAFIPREEHDQLTMAELFQRSGRLFGLTEGQLTSDLASIDALLVACNEINCKQKETLLEERKKTDMRLHNLRKMFDDFVSSFDDETDQP